VASLSGMQKSLTKLSNSHRVSHLFRPYPAVSKLKVNLAELLNFLLLVFSSHNTKFYPADKKLGFASIIVDQLPKKGGKPENPKKEIFEARCEPTANSTHIWHRAGFEPGPHLSEASNASHHFPSHLKLGQIFKC